MSSKAALTTASLQPELWTSSSNEVLKLFVTNSEGAINFQPVFTYPIFGDSETIYGYKDLVIFLCFDHYTFYPFLNIKYSEKLDDPEIIDIKQTIDKFLPESTVFKDEVQWVDSINQEKTDYKIPGDKIDSFEKEIEGEINQFEIYKLDLHSVSGLELHKRLQILVLLFIEAGSYIDAKDELWNVYVLYNTTNEEEPSVVGFTTVYNYFKYPGFEKFDNNEKETRLKISQFVILPTYQGQRLGGEFYARLFEKWFEDPDVIEIVVEDPNESFDDLRDRSDFIRLNKSIKFDDINSRLDAQWIKDTRSKLKLEKRQFSRLLELTLLYKLKYKLGNDSKKDVRLFIKKRLFEKNREGLEALDENNRKDKLQTAYESLEQDYYRILGDIKFATKRQLEI